MWATLRSKGHVLHVSRHLRPEYERLMAAYSASRRAPATSCSSPEGEGLGPRKGQSKSSAGAE